MNYIIITTINPPTEAVKKFSDIENHKLVVVADKRTPQNWQCNNVDLISLHAQSLFSYKILDHLPYNHYSRKMLGYLYAIQKGAQIIIDTDDDNIPKTNWEFPEFDGKFQTCGVKQGFLNVYNLFTDQFIWPRGFPLSKIRNNDEIFVSNVPHDCKIGIWQGLADEDPDVDAIYRLVFDKACTFRKRSPIVLNKGSICPFNSQNTAFRKELFPLLYLPSHVSFRFTDILRGIVAQPIMWLYGFTLGFTEPTVTQIRNPHDYTKDFESEISMYCSIEKIVKIVHDAIQENETITANLFNSYQALCRDKIVKKEELTVLDLWLKELSDNGIN